MQDFRRCRAGRLCDARDVSSFLARGRSPWIEIALGSRRATLGGSGERCVVREMRVALLGGVDGSKGKRLGVGTSGGLTKAALEFIKYH